MFIGYTARMHWSALRLSYQAIRFMPAMITATALIISTARRFRFGGMTFGGFGAGCVTMASGVGLRLTGDVAARGLSCTSALIRADG